MHVVILHNAVSPDASAADRDVLVQADAVSGALEHLGHRQSRIAATLDLSTLRSQLLALRPDVVFNLVESLDGSDWLAFLVTGLLDSLCFPYSGAPTEALMLTNHKLRAKELLTRAGLPTPAWFTNRSRRREQVTCSLAPAFQPGTTYLLKAVWQHASLGMDDDCIVKPGTQDNLRSLLSAHADRLACPCFAEQYIDGREFNLSLLASPEGVQVLPPAEIDFGAFPSGKPRIVGCDAKWNEGSFEFRHTPRTFDIPDSDRSLVSAISAAARDCWYLFGLAGYARVDFRVDAEGHPWILEINANPCLSPDAGFAAALERAGIPIAEATARILDVPGE
jgi:D-alanine-D-alanine ligase